MSYLQRLYEHFNSGEETVQESAPGKGFAAAGGSTLGKVTAWGEA
jgi:hypothetical protein